MKNKIFFLGIIMFLISHKSINAQSLIRHDFNNGSMGQFVECTTKSPNYAKVVNNRLKTYWTESGYDGSRTSKGCEACGAQDYLTHKEGWMGFNMNVASFPSNSEGAVAQIFGFDNSKNWFSWSGMLLLQDGDLKMIRRHQLATQFTDVVYPNFPYNQDVSIILHFILSGNGNGLIEIWVNGSKVYTVNNIYFGMGDFNSSDEQYGDSYTEFKIGQYNYQNDEYTSNEERIIYFDNISWWNGASGYSIVNPAGAMSPDRVVTMRKSNSTSYAIDGNNSNNNFTKVWLYQYSSGNGNQKWVEVDRGDGYFSYRKNGTNSCLDGNNGGSPDQLSYLYSCQSGNHNQHWLKVAVPGKKDHYRLIKRNASGYSLDGSNGGDNQVQLKIYPNNASNGNQQWIFTDRGHSTSKFTEQKVTEESLDEFSIFPNPVKNELNIKFNSYDNKTTIQLYNVNGQKVLDANPSSEVKLDFSKLNTGIYVLMINNKSENFTKKIVKL